jgi:outer membrane lipoprotein SlyB
MKSLLVSAVTALIGAIVSSTVLAQEAPPVRIRGTIERVDGNRLVVKARDGSSVNVTLADNARITAMAKAQLSDVKQGSFIGVTAMPQPDGSQKAIGLHIFMESQKGVVADRHFPWDREPGSTMTNANVESLVSSVDGQTIMVKYKDGEKKVVVPPDTPIVTYTPGDKSELKPGVKIFMRT